MIGAAMSYLCRLCLLLVLVVSMTGCKDTPVVPPDAARLSVSCQFPDAPDERVHFDVASPAMRSRFVAALRTVDWSQPGEDLAVAGDLPAPDIELTLTDKSGNSQMYQFFWTGDVILDPHAARLLDADVTDLRDLVSELRQRNER